MAGPVTFEAVVFDLFGTLVPEFSKKDFFQSVREMARVLGADPDRFEAAWTGTALERQTGGFATVEDNVRHICASLGLEPSDDALARRWTCVSTCTGRGSSRAAARSRR